MQTASLFLPILFCGDEVTDILYLIENWDNFANEHLKNSAIAFTLINAIINFFAACLLMCFLKGLNGTKCILACLLCGWIPILAIIFVLVYSKGIELAVNCNKGDDLFSDVKTI